MGVEVTDSEKLDLILSQLVTMKADINGLHDKVNGLNDKVNDLNDKVDAGFERVDLILENEIRGDIKLLAEGYVPAANKFENSADKIELLERDMKLLTHVVSEHSGILNKLNFQ